MKGGGGGTVPISIVLAKKIVGSAPRVMKNPAFPLVKVASTAEHFRTPSA
jgi:hypothetical protein